MLKVWNWRCKVGNGDQSYHEQNSELEKMGAMRVLQETAGAVGSPVFQGQITTLQHSTYTSSMCVVSLWLLLWSQQTQPDTNPKTKEKKAQTWTNLWLMTSNWHQISEICHGINYEPKLPSLGLVMKSTPVSIKTCTNRCKFQRNHQSLLCSATFSVPTLYLHTSMRLQKNLDQQF